MKGVRAFVGEDLTPVFEFTDSIPISVNKLTQNLEREERKQYFLNQPYIAKHGPKSYTESKKLGDHQVKEYIRDEKGGIILDEHGSLAHQTKIVQRTQLIPLNITCKSIGLLPITANKWMVEENEPCFFSYGHLSDKWMELVCNEDIEL